MKDIVGTILLALRVALVQPGALEHDGGIVVAGLLCMWIVLMVVLVVYVTSRNVIVVTRNVKMDRYVVVLVENGLAVIVLILRITVINLGRLRLGVPINVPITVAFVI